MTERETKMKKEKEQVIQIKQCMQGTKIKDPSGVLDCAEALCSVSSSPVLSQGLGLNSWQLAGHVIPSAAPS